MFAEVIVDISHADTDKIFEYSFTDNRITVGSRVLVPFGKKVIEGIVIAVKDTCSFDLSKIKEVTDLLEETPAFTEETLALSSYIVDSCYVTRALAFRLFLPAEMRKGKVRDQFVDYAKIRENINVDDFVQTLKKMR